MQTLRNLLLLLTLSACLQPKTDACGGDDGDAQFNHADGQSILSLTTGQSVAQSFFLTGEANQRANHLDVVASSANSNESTWTYILRELTDSDDPTAGPIAAQGSATASGTNPIPTNANDLAVVLFDEDEPVTLVAEKPYWLVVTPPADANASFGTTNPNSYVGHMFVSTSNGWALSSDANQLAFSVSFYTGCD